MMRAIAAILALALAVTAAHAQSPRVRPQITGDVIADTKANLGIKPAAAPSLNTLESSFTDLHAQLQKVAKDTADKVIADLNAAITDATNQHDAISLPCWQANLAFVQMLPVEWPTPPAEIGIALGIQIQRDLLNAITGTQPGSIKVACAALFGDELKIVANIGAMFGLRVATGGAL
jgi:hypothetical protein